MHLSSPVLILVVSLCLTAPLVAQRIAAPDATEPDPSLTPGQVIAIQLKALRSNRDMADDGGIAITFNFASPANRRMTGPLARFVQMLKNPLYTIMLDFDRYETGKLEREGRQSTAARHVDRCRGDTRRSSCGCYRSKSRRPTRIAG